MSGTLWSCPSPCGWTNTSTDLNCQRCHHWPAVTTEQAWLGNEPVTMEYRTTAAVQAEHVREWQADGWSVLGGASGWAAQAMRLPVSWYQSIEQGSGAEYPVSGDATTLDLALETYGGDPKTFFARGCIAHGSRPLPLRA